MILRGLGLGCEQGSSILFSNFLRLVSSVNNLICCIAIWFSLTSLLSCAMPSLMNRAFRFSGFDRHTSWETLHNPLYCPFFRGLRPAILLQSFRTRQYSARLLHWHKHGLFADRSALLESGFLLSACCMDFIVYFCKISPFYPSQVLPFPSLSASGILLSGKA